MLDENKIRHLYHALINDEDFEKLELELKTPNIFQILNISRTEIRHSNFLAWLLDSNANHGIGKLLLLKFIRDLAFSDMDKMDEFDIFKINYDDVEIRREWKGIDILLIFNSMVVVIENKIDTKDHSRQLERYYHTVSERFKDKKKIFVYLTPFGEQPKSAFGKDVYIPYSYEQLARHIQQILHIHGEGMNAKVYQYISDYLTNLKRSIMKNDRLNILAAKIYKNHKELFDFIMENKPDLAMELYPVFERFLKKKGMVIGSKNKGYIRFLTPALHQIIPRTGTGWPEKENFLFEIDYYWRNSLVFKTTISPGDPEVVQILNEAISPLEGAKKPEGKKWLVHFQKKFKFNKEKYIDGIDEEEINQLLEKFWNDIFPIIKKVEEAVLAQKDRLSAFK